MNPYGCFDSYPYSFGSYNYNSMDYGMQAFNMYSTSYETEWWNSPSYYEQQYDTSPNSDFEISPERRLALEQKIENIVEMIQEHARECRDYQKSVQTSLRNLEYRVQQLWEETEIRKQESIVEVTPEESYEDGICYSSGAVSSLFCATNLLNKSWWWGWSTVFLIFHFPGVLNSYDFCKEMQRLARLWYCYP